MLPFRLSAAGWPARRGERKSDYAGTTAPSVLGQKFVEQCPFALSPEPVEGSKGVVRQAHHER